VKVRMQQKFVARNVLRREKFGCKGVLEKAAVPAPGIVQVSLSF